MTDALCLNCGAIKFGALCPCPQCQAPATGNINLDIAFSDHNFARQTLEELGQVIVAIHEVSAEEELCFWSFLSYIETNHPEVLRIKLEPEARRNVNACCHRLRYPTSRFVPAAGRKLGETERMSRRRAKRNRGGSSGDDLGEVSMTL
jgi:hypothetical protein